ncbi:hypothetical protein GBZ26_04125 [Azospirillum formosense]|uniref:Uncharacterized protein n=1 Tax=Azospirillum formosense TaxID=861533 RepID=A0ABX2KP76_9PROT|nr:hypothetical protein [Azospirillum formosense]
MSLERGSKPRLHGLKPLILLGTAGVLIGTLSNRLEIVLSKPRLQWEYSWLSSLSSPLLSWTV